LRRCVIRLLATVLIALCCIEQGLSRFPYESNDGSPCLKTEASHIGQQLCYVLQEKVLQAGVLVHSVQLSNISYSPEIAAAMLKRQQAAAMVEARNTIVEGAVDIACHAVDKLATVCGDRGGFAGVIALAFVTDSSDHVW
jgi:membrane protease subunit (stomatin/prohibitin family)